MLSELYAKYIEHNKKEQELEKLILRHKKRLLKLQSKGGWRQQCLAPLAEQLSQHLGMPYEVYGPYGMGGETPVYFFPGGKTGNITQLESYSITLHPACKDGPGSYAERFYFTYNTGERRNDYAEGTIGAMNGFNNVEAPLPDDLDAIVAIIKKNHYVPKGEKK